METRARAGLLEHLAGWPVDVADRRSPMARWLVQLRWVACAGAALVVAGAAWQDRLAPGAGWPLWGGVLGLAVFNVALSARAVEAWAHDRGLALQIAGDALLLAWLLHHAGGLTNPFSAMFVFHATTAAVVLPAVRARRVAAGIGLLIGSLAALEATGVWPAWPLSLGHGAPAPLDAGLLVVSGLSAMGITLGAGAIVGVLVTRLRDERRLLADERERLQTIIDCMGDAVLFVTPDGVIRLRNAAAQQLWPEGSPPDADLRACHPAERWDALLGLLGRAEPLAVHPVLAVRGRHFEASWSHVTGPDGRPHGVVMVARDITERVARQQHQMQEERMATVGKLASGLAHELNNPLGAIALFTQHALSTVRPDEPLADHLGTVLRNANLCKTIVRDLLAYARRRPPERSDTSVAELLADVERTLSPRAAANGATLCVDVGPGTPTAVFGDADQLRQVLVNLGLNALEAIGMRRGMVCLSASAVPGVPEGVRFGVADDGPGIPPEERERVFQAFHTTKAEGTGLGLTVAADIVRAHGGVLQLDAVDGCGCSFSFVVTPPVRLLSRARATAVVESAHG
jgi:signal transduction histidine kinase